jgi:hypothetical protein
MARITNQKISPTQTVGAREKMMPPHTVVGTRPDYRPRLAVTCECDDCDQHEDADERHRHRNPGPAPIHRAFVRIPMMPVTISATAIAAARIQTTSRRGVILGLLDQRKQDRFADAETGERHQETVDSHPHSTGRRHAVLEGAKEFLVQSHRLRVALGCE